jgi:hypothetical protein
MAGGSTTDKRTSTPPHGTTVASRLSPRRSMQGGGRRPTASSAPAMAVATSAPPPNVPHAQSRPAGLASELHSSTSKPPTAPAARSSAGPAGREASRPSSVATGSRGGRRLPPPLSSPPVAWLQRPHSLAGEEGAMDVSPWGSENGRRGTMRGRGGSRGVKKSGTRNSWLVWGMKYRGRRVREN